MTNPIEVLLAYFVDGTELGFDDYDRLIAEGLVQQETHDNSIGFTLTDAGRAAVKNLT